MNDPITEAIGKVLLEYQEGKLEPAAQKYGPLTKGMTGLLMRLQSDIKKLNLQDRDLLFESMVSQRTQQPMVRIMWGEQEGQLTSEEARETAMKLWDVAHGADADAFVFSFFTDNLNIPKEKMYGLLQEFREYRERQAELQHKQVVQPRQNNQ